MILLNPTMKETYDRERGMMFPSNMSECTLNNIAHHKNILMALEKQIPMKPVIRIWPNRIPAGQEVLVCPLCGDAWNENEYGSGMEYCWTCGQKIDWEE